MSMEATLEEKDSAAAEQDGVMSPIPDWPRILVAVASYGEKNLDFLRHLIRQYRSMPFPVDVVVLSEAPKHLPDDVQVRVGLPSRNPWSLPFAHKQVFAENAERYDVFIYSEDDIDVTEAHIRAFLEMTATLKDDEVAGFLRYERGADGTVWMPDAHGRFHWQPESVVRRGEHTFAYFTNLHAALYMLTRAQLKRALASGGFVREPYEGIYDMLCAAATDPYTSCGLRKLICISSLERFMVHHMSDRYAGRMGIPLELFRDQVGALHEIHAGARRAVSLCGVDTKITGGEWSKGYYEQPRAELIEMIPDRPGRVLSVGCGWGALERELRDRGAEITALPLDSVIGATVARLGIRVLDGTLDELLDRLVPRTFDCVVVSNLLHLLPDPESTFARCLRLVAAGGVVVVDSPNFQRMPLVIQQILNAGRFRIGSFDESGVKRVAPGTLWAIARRDGCTETQVRWYEHSLPSILGLRRLQLPLGRLTAGGWIFKGLRRG